MAACPWKSANAESLLTHSISMLSPMLCQKPWGTHAQTQEILNEQKFTVVGGENSGTRMYADGKFRTFYGNIIETI